MSTAAQPQTCTHVAASPDRRRCFLLTVAGYIGWNVVAAVVGLIAKLPDIPASHAHTDRLTLGQVLAGNGTIMSPPLVLMIPVGLLAWASMTSRVWVSRAATLITAALVAVFGDKPALYSTGKWHLCIALGTMFDIFGVAVMITGLLWAIATRR